MSKALMKSVSGIRGVVGETMTPELILSVSAAFSRYLNRGLIVIGRDSRPTGEAVIRGVVSALALSGSDVIDIGIVPTPTVEVMVEELGAAGGIVISASHNPIEWNAFKLINGKGVFLNREENADFFASMSEEPEYVTWESVGTITENNDAGKIHIERVCRVIDGEIIKKKKFRVVLDSVNGAGSLITPDFLHGLGCEVVPLHCTMDGTFPRGPEPVPENLADLSAAVIKEKADIGFAQDPDADRLAVVDNTGRPIGEENTIALVVEHLLSKEAGRVVINLSTTAAVDRIAERYGADVTRTRVGEINVVDEMLTGGARIGGEGNGGVISPEIHYGRDSLAGIGYILQMMAERELSISAIVDSLPKLYMKKGKFPYNPDTFKESLLDDLQQEFEQESLSLIDGLRIEFTRHKEFSGGWVHLRKSNTEPAFRVIAEGVSPEQRDAIYSYFLRYFS